MNTAVAARSGSGDSRGFAPSVSRRVDAIVSDGGRLESRVDLEAPIGILPLLAVVHVATAAPLTLDEALALAAKRNAALVIARADQATAAADALGSYQGVLPRLDLTGTLGHEYTGSQQQVSIITNPNPPPEFLQTRVTVPGTDFGLYQWGVNMTWTLFDGLASWNAIASSRARAAAADRGYDESALQTAFDVTRRYYELLKQQRALEVLRETAALSAEFVQRADALFSAARGTKADTFSARVNLANDQIAARSQLAAVARARADLAFVLGLPSDEGLEVAPPPILAQPGSVAAEPLPPLSELLASARKRRPLLASQKRLVEAADQDVSRAQGAYWPVVAAQGSYVRQTPDLGGSNGLFASLSNQYVATIQLTIAFNVFAGGSTRAGVQRSEALASRAQAVLQQGEESVSAEVTSARAQVEALAGSVATAQQGLEAAERGLRATRERLDAGVTSQLEVRDATLKAAQAKLTAFDTLVDLVVARADLNRAVGGAL